VPSLVKEVNRKTYGNIITHVLLYENFVYFAAKIFLLFFRYALPNIAVSYPTTKRKSRINMQLFLFDGDYFFPFFAAFLSSISCFMANRFGDL
jgi:hypothetical protein